MFVYPMGSVRIWSSGYFKTSMIRSDYDLRLKSSPVSKTTDREEYSLPKKLKYILFIIYYISLITKCPLMPFVTIFKKILFRSVYWFPLYTFINWYDFVTLHKRILQLFVCGYGNCSYGYCKPSSTISSRRSTLLSDEIS